MADEEGNSGGAGEPSRRRRVPPPTIDLEATDVSAQGEPAAEPTTPTPDPAGSATSAAATSAAAASGETAPAAPPADDPADKPPHAAEPPPAAAAGEPRAMPIGPLAAAGAFGAVLALIVAGGMWAMLGPASERQADTNARLSRIEAQLGGLSRPAPGPGAGDSKSLD